MYMVETIIHRIMTFRFPNLTHVIQLYYCCYLIIILHIIIHSIAINSRSTYLAHPSVTAVSPPRTVDVHFH